VRLLLIDTDVFVLLAAAGLVGRVAELLGFELTEVRRLHPVERQLTRGRQFRQRFPEPVREKALFAARTVAPITERPEDDTLLQKLTLTDIDEGEALMIALLAENPSWLLTTGDRRALVSLAKDSALADVRAAVAGRLVPIESVLRKLVTTDGVEAVAAAFAPVRDCDIKLRVIFSEANATNLDSCLEGIDSYLAALKREVGEGLLYSAP
jgi:hypothetical protein